MGKTLVIVESPTKARTMTRFLPKGKYVIVASVGHVRDLPQSAKDIPVKYKGEAWANLGIDVERDFAPLYILPRGKAKIVKELRAAVKQADEVILATDEDREGESISWHLMELLKPNIPIKRMVFHEITATAIREALHNFRDINMRLVRAQETRRILDRLFGYTLSPIIWKKIAFGLSAGRVQSPGLRMIVQRERERMRHVSTVYWDLVAQVAHAGGKDGGAGAAGKSGGVGDKSEGEGEGEARFEARLIEVDGKRLVASGDFDSITGARTSADTRILTEKECVALIDTLREAEWRVESITEKESRVNPPIPFITATLQQHANRRLRLSSRETMRIAQRLYESGKITYMRTDSPHLSGEATNAARAAVASEAGKEFLSDKARYFRGGKGEAHEAIRPASAKFLPPRASGLTGRELGLYTMIWQRTLATQMKAGLKRSMKVILRAANTRFEASGTRIVFPGFLKIYANEKSGAGDAILPPMSEGDRCYPRDIAPKEHATRPPARFTEATLIQQLEERGIGRPSTYASIISTLYDRDYIRDTKQALIPTFTGMAVIQLLETHFDKYIDYSFTANMEEVLDTIAVGQRDNLLYLRQFYTGSGGLAEIATKKEQEIDAAAMRVVHLPDSDPAYQIRVGRYGPYVVHKVGDKELRASIPEDIAPSDLAPETLRNLIEAQRNGPVPVAQDPQTNLPVYLLTGRYGAYLQVGGVEQEGGSGAGAGGGAGAAAAAGAGATSASATRAPAVASASAKPKRVTIPQEYRGKEITSEIALRLLSLPRTVGAHPDSGKSVIANRGRFGPYIAHGSETRSLRKPDDPYTITLSRAVKVLAAPKGQAAARRSQLIRELGKEPGGETVALYGGKYGPYLKVGKRNIRLPDELRTEEALGKLDLEMVRSVIA